MLESKKEFLKNVSKCNTKDNVASELVIAVMTVCGKLGSGVNLLDIFDYYMKGNCENFELSYVPNSKKTPNGTKNKAFYNCLGVTFYMTDSNGIENKIAAKVFPNGSIQVPGCRTIDAVYKAPKIIYEFIKDISEKIPNVIKEPDNFNLKDVRIVMINSNFSFHKHINQELVKNLVNENKFEGKMIKDRMWRIATFQPEKYAGVNIKYWTKKARTKYQKYFLEYRPLPKQVDGQISILIFKSGKGTITGAKNTKDLLEAYNAITNFFRNNNDEIFYK